MPTKKKKPVKRIYEEEESMSDADFNKLLTKRMIEHGIPVGVMRSTIEHQAINGRNMRCGGLDTFLDEKRYRDEVLAVTGRLSDVMNLW